MPFNQRLKIFEAIKGSSIHQSLATPSSQAAMARCQVTMVVVMVMRIWRALRIMRMDGISLMQKYSSVFSQPFHSHMSSGGGVGLDDDEDGVYGMRVEDILILKVQSA